MINFKIMSDENKPQDDSVSEDLEQVKKQLESKQDSLKIAALKNALNYGDRGLDLVISALRSDKFTLQKAAYSLLSKRKEKRAIQATKELNKYLFFECKLTIRNNLIDYHSMALTSDGKIIVSCAGGEKTIKVWSSKTGELINTLIGHQKQVNCVAIRNDDEIIVSASQDCTIKMWSLKTGQLLKTIKTRYPRYYSIISGEPQYKGCLFGLLPLGGHYNCISNIDLSTIDDDEIIVTGHDRGYREQYTSIKIWHRKTEKLLRILIEDAERILSVAISKDGESIVTGSNYGSIKIWGLPEI